MGRKLKRKAITALRRGHRREARPARTTARNGGPSIPAEHEESPPVSPTLIEPSMAAFMRKVAAGELSEAELQRKGTLTSAPSMALKLLPFLHSSEDFTKLADALKTTPSLLWHPFAYRIIKHLRDVRSDLAPRAQANLCKLVEAIASGLLDGAWSLKPPPKRPGRKAMSPEDVEFGLLDESATLMESLRGERLPRGKGESEGQRARRVAEIVRLVWERSSLSHEYPASEPPEPVRNPGQDYSVEDLFDTPIRWRVVPPPPFEEIVGWVEDAYRQSRATGRPVRSQLVWKMLAHRYGLTENQIRYRIDTAGRYGKETT